MVVVGCVSPVPLPPVERPVSAAYRGADPGDTALAPPPQRWWTEFRDPELDRLADLALQNNRELKAAVARVAQAMAQARFADAQFFPTVDGYASREAVAPTVGIGQAESRNEWNQLNRYKVGLRASYEADLWGKTTAGANSALAAALASGFQRETVALTLTAELAAAYFEVLSLDERIGISRRSVDARRQQVAGMAKRVERGDATISDLSQFRVLLGTAESNAAALEQRRERVFNRLAVMVGVPPAELKISRVALGSVTVPEPSAGLPSALLCRRPDLRRLEAQLKAAEFDVQALRASLLPGFSLTADIGTGARHLAQLGSPASLFFLATGTLLQTVFDGGRKEAQLDVAKAKHLDLLEQYAGAILNALRDVEDALSGARLTGAQRDALAEGARAARANLEAARRSVDAGAADILALFEAEVRLVAAEEALESARLDRVRGAVDLYRALGGGSLMQPGERCEP